MIQHGEAPYLECSTAGDSRFSAFCARVECRGGKTIERIYQAAKVFSDGLTGLDPRNAKGRRASNQEEVNVLYEQLWREYIAENPDLVDVLLRASGLSDKFGKLGHMCQATVLWKLRGEYLNT
jgi:hypothetical protein